MHEISNFFLSKDNEVEVGEYLSGIFKTILCFKNREKVINYKNNEQLLERYVKDLPEGKKSLKDIKFILEDILNDSMNFSSRMFMGFPDSGNSIAGLAGGVVEATCQQNLLNSDFCARAATFIEVCTVRWLRELLGYSNNQYLTSVKDLGGVATTGGTCSNMYGILMARKRAYPESFLKGLRATERPKIFIPEDVTHYSIAGAAGVIGFGTENIIKIKTKNFALDLKDLDIQLRKSKNDGDKIVSVILNAGDSRTLTIDPIKNAIEIIKFIEPSCWIHVDACHGGQLLFSHKYRDRISGIEFADSISLDPHKVFNLPYALSYFLFKDPHEIEGFWTSSSLIMRDPWSLGQTTPNIGSKTWSALKFYLFVQHLGKFHLGTVIDDRIEMADKFRKIVDSDSSFKLLTNNSDINSVTFLYVGAENNLIDSRISLYELNEKIYKTLLTQGDFYLHGFPIKDDCNILGFGKDHKVFALRYMCGNPTIQEKDLRDLIIKLLNVAKETMESLI